MTDRDRGTRLATMTRGDDPARRWLLDSGIRPAVVDEWAELGPLGDAIPLININYPLSSARLFPRSPNTLKSLSKALPETRRAGLKDPDLPWWHAGGVMMLRRPWVVENVWRTWRPIVVHHLGSRQAALSAAAGISPKEALTMVRNRTWDEETVTFMAGLRLGNR